MSKIKESKVYLNFLTKNLFLIILGGLIFGGLGYLYNQSKPTIYHSSNIYELIPLPNLDPNIQADQIVSVLRTPQVKQQLINNVNGDTPQITTYKSGPYLISIDVQSGSKSDVEATQLKIDRYMKDNFHILPKTEPLSFNQKSSTIFDVGLGFVIGCLFTVIFKLIKIYLQNF